MDEEKRQEEQGPLPRTREAVGWWLKKWGSQAVVDGKEPLTREDVERLIGVNGGTAEGLNLSGRDLRNARLTGINLQGANLQEANLQNAVLSGANLLGANKGGAYLHGARLICADLRDANLRGAQISSSTNLEAVTWDPKYINILERKGDFEEAIAMYRRLKEWHRGAGMLTIAGDFHYREEAALTKAHWQRIGREFRSEVKEFVRRMVKAWRQLKGERGTTRLKE